MESSAIVDEESVQIFQIQSEGSFQSEQSGSAVRQKEIVIDGVKFTPGQMLFENAYEGKCFKQKLIIQNCGSSSAFIRLCQPNSAAIIYKSFEKGLHLSPGLKITRLVTFTYCSSLAVPGAFAPIHVNDHSFNYKFIVTMSSPVITLEPTHLNFGRIDAVNAATTRTLTIKNSGCKGTLFAVDLGRNKLDLIVDPMKGSAPAKSVVTLTVELVGSQAGAFAEEFWIKTTPPQRVVVEGTFIAPMLMVRKFITTLDFCLIDFNKVFVGSRSTKVLIIRNYSSSHSIFFVMAEIQGKAMPLEEAKKIDNNYRNFFVNPEDGRMRAQKGSVVQITFAPETYSPKDRSYCACFFKVARVDCRDYTDEIIFNEQDIHDYRTLRTESIIGSNDNKEDSDDDTQSTQQIFFRQEPDDPTLLTFETSIRVCVHAEKEIPAVILRPDLVCLDELILGKTYERELRIENASSYLPISVRYKKMTSVEVSPEIIHLKPNQSIEVKILIRAAAVTKMCDWIFFELLAADVPSDLKMVRKVGSTYVQLQVNTTQVVKPRRWKSCCMEMSKDLEQKLEVDYPFKLTDSELKHKEKNDNFYLNYIRNHRAKREDKQNSAVTVLPDYEVTFKHRDRKVPVLCAPYVEKQVIPFEFIPLPPKLLYNIKITPKSFRMRRVAAFTVTTESFRIHNKNTFPVYIHLERSKPCITFPFNARHVIEPDESRDIPVNFSSSSNGRYHITIAVIVNNSNIFEVTAIADVVPKTLKVDATKIEFKENEINYKFFNLTNTLNSDTTFQWEIPLGAFEIHPTEGRVPAECALTCMVSYNPNLSLPDTSECILTAESGQKMLMQFVCKTRSRSLAFSTYEIDFGAIPLNVETTQKCIMQNLKVNRVIFVAKFDPDLSGITVVNSDGVLLGKASHAFVISVHLSAVITFNTKLKIILDEVETVEITVKGTVDFPHFSLSPDMLYFRKIAPYSFDCLVFKVKNVSQCEISVTFPLEGDFPEFSITDEEDVSNPHRSRFTLLPEEAKVLYLHFHPYYVSTYAFYLPVIINDILGPLVMNGGETNSTRYFLREAEALYPDLPAVTMPSVPNFLPTLRVNCCAVNKSLQFSTYELNFVYYGEDHPSNITTQEVVMSNASEEPIDICIRIDEVEDPFYFEPTEGDDDSELLMENVSIVLFKLEPEAKKTFRATFSPASLGTYKIKLPVFLHHYYDNKIFNYIRMKGLYTLPSIVPSQTHFHLESIPLKIKTETKLTLRMVNHLPDCTVQSQTDLNGLCAIFQEGRDPLNEDSNLSVLLSYTAVTAICFNADLVFYCTCHASCKVYVSGVAEHCILTSHPYFQYLKEQYGAEELLSRHALSREEDADMSSTSLLISNWYDNLICHNETSFPLFPEDSDNGEYAVYIRDVLQSVERWVFTQGFFSKQYYRIPEGFTDYCMTNEPHKLKKQKNYMFNTRKKKAYSEPPLVQLLIHLSSPQMKSCLIDHDYDPDRNYTPMQEMVHMYKIYANCLSLVRTYDAYLPHVKAKYLLNYDHYLLYLKMRNRNTAPDMDRHHYYRFTKQCWLDLILQTIKVFVLYRMEVQTSCDKEALSNPSITEPEDLLPLQDDVVPEPNSTRTDNEVEVLKYNPQELVLIQWLEKCYAEERYDLWGDCAEPIRTVILLAEGLSDGLLLGAATAHYCPYVKNNIRKMYGCPVNPEDLFHNACQLVIIWNMLHLSYDIDPRKIAKPNPVEMLLLITYLYDVLPSCCPTETINIEAPLTQRASKKIELQNLGFAPINYELVFFGNTQKLFSVPSNSYRVAPHKKRVVEISYHAKSVKTTSATLLFSGETPGHRYGKSMAVRLMGVPDVTYICKEINISVELYKLCEVTLNLESPFPMAAEYDLYIGAHNQSELYSWEDLKLLKTIKECIPEPNAPRFDEEGKKTDKVQLCCLQHGPRAFWLYYTNNEVGDWSIRCTITGKVNKSHFEDIDVQLPKNYRHFTCCCKNGIHFTSRCPLNVKIRVPAKNNKLWNAMKKIMLKSVQGQELKFWRKRIFTTTGTRIITLILNSETHPVRQTIHTTVEYKIITEKGCPFKTLQNIQIEDITSEDSVELPIHPFRGKILEDGAVITMRLLSQDETEKRFYNVRFHGESDDNTASLNEPTNK